MGLPHMVIICVILLSIPMPYFLEDMIVTPSTSDGRGDGSGGSGQMPPDQVLPSRKSARVAKDP